MSKTSRRQNRVYSEGEIAERDGAMRAEDNLPSVPDAGQGFKRILHQDLQVFGRVLVDEGDRGVEAAGEDHPAEAGKHGLTVPLPFLGQFSHKPGQ